jgi:hypothetical protein
VPENNAIVRIISGKGDTFGFPDGHEGIYQMLFKAEENETYRLEVTVNGTVYTSEGRTIPINGIDSLYCRQMINPENGDSAWYVYMDAGRSYPMDTRYYMLDMTKNEELITYGSEIWIFRDSYTDSINGIKFPIAFQKGDTVIIGLSSLSNSMFDYYFKLSYEVFTINLSNISYRCNLPMMFDPKAMGYFQVSCTDRKEIIIKQADQ